MIVGPPPVQILDVTGPLEVFSNGPDYLVQLATPGKEPMVQTCHGITLGGAVLLDQVRMPIDTLVVARGRGAEGGI